MTKEEALKESEKHEKYIGCRFENIEDNTIKGTILHIDGNTPTHHNGKDYEPRISFEIDGVHGKNNCTLSIFFRIYRLIP